MAFVNFDLKPSVRVLARLLVVRGFSRSSAANQLTDFNLINAPDVPWLVTNPSDLKLQILGVLALLFMFHNLST